MHVAGRAEIYELKGELGLRATTVERIGLGDHLVALEQLKRAARRRGAVRRGAQAPAAARSARGRDPHRRRRRGARRPRRDDQRPVPGDDGRRPRGARAGEGRRAGDRRRRSTSSTARPDVDVVVLARGGGSVEDLLPFSDEAVVRAVAACRVPVVSAVGHEQDTPLCDLAADARAATPTAAGALVVPDLARARVGARRRATATRARAPSAGRARPRPADAAGRAPAGAPRLLLERRRAALDRAGARLQTLSPLATLSRGYAIVRAGGDALRSAADVGSRRPARRPARRRAR